MGGRAAVNWLDRRPDGTQWCPLALAVVHGSEDMVEAGGIGLRGEGSQSQKAASRVCLLLRVPSFGGVLKGNQKQNTFFGGALNELEQH